MILLYALCLNLYLLTIVHLVRSDQCPAPSPCTCSNKTIDCDNKHLSSVPPITSTSNTSYRLNLRWNPGLVITDDSFRNVSLEYLNIDGNNNMTISPNALARQSNSLKEFSCRNANLDSVPTALGDLNAVKKVSFYNNIIHNWDERLMRRLGRSINTLNVAYTGLKSWPHWISHIWKLVDLNLSGNDIRIIPHGAFHTFSSTLVFLNIESTGITNIPTALETLHNLKYLSIGGSTITDSSFYETWLPSSGLNILRIVGTNITTIPSGIDANKSIDVLYIHGSNIKHIEEGSLPNNLKYLTIADSLLNRIDGGICKPYLLQLDFSKNKLTTIEKYDLNDCKEITFLDLSDNDINYISPSAFNHSLHLVFINLKGNKLINIPTAVIDLKEMSFLFLNQNPLECSCDDSWFPEWRHHMVEKNTLSVKKVHGNCTYLGVDLMDFNPQCSQFFIG